MGREEQRMERVLHYSWGMLTVIRKSPIRRMLLVYQITQSQADEIERSEESDDAHCL